MHVGMLWFDNDKTTGLAAKVERAAGYYRRKYGQHPNVCLVHPSMLPGTGVDDTITLLGKLSLQGNRCILPGHLWIGIEEE